MSTTELLMLLMSSVLVRSLPAQDIAMADSFKRTIAPLPTGYNDTKTENQLSTGKLIVPSALITAGILSLTTKGMKNLNSSTRFEIYEHQPKHTLWDNYTQYAPVMLVYGLNLAGVKGKHNLHDRTLIYATSQLIATAMVVPLKYATREARPDGSDFRSFPSGHTATAFSSAQFMFREFRNNNFWLSIAGYPIAVFTGVYRTFNNKHWAGDVLAGAGIGILSTEIAYWLSPISTRLLGGQKQDHYKVLLPQYNNGTYGLTYTQNF